MGERMAADWPLQEGHRFRYHLASGFTSPGDTFLDAACGTGYASKIIINGRSDIKYVGIDKFASLDMDGFYGPHVKFAITDLATYTPDFNFDVFAGFETIEHLDDYSHYLETAKRAKKWILLSVPVVPTRYMNEFHKHDFKRGELPKLVIDDEWKSFQTVDQPSEFSEIYVFRRAR